VRDVVGCGNACCGAFLAALARGEGLAAAAAWGCAAGSVMAEHLGVPRPPPAALRPGAAVRQAALAAAARPVRLGGGGKSAGARRGAGVRVEAAAGAATPAALPRRSAPAKGRQALRARARAPMSLIAYAS
jgi:hypothetical protein